MYFVITWSWRFMWWIFSFFFGSSEVIAADRPVVEGHIPIPADDEFGDFGDDEYVADFDEFE